jgi:hypothetical protein
MMIAKRLLYSVFVLGIVSASAQTRPAPASAASSIPATCEPAPGHPAVALPDLTGTYSANGGISNDGIYYVQQSGSKLWWAGLSLEKATLPEHQWHRGLDFTNVFRGTIFCDGHIEGQWVDVPRGAELSDGTLTLAIDASHAVPVLRQTSATGEIKTNFWEKRTQDLNDLAVSSTARMDIASRFHNVLKNPSSQDTIPPRHSLLGNLEPYRDQTVVFGRLITVHPDPQSDTPGGDRQPPHVDFAVDDFGHKDRDLPSFCKDPNDGDFDLRLKVQRLEPAFLTTGWGDHDLGPRIFNAKFDSVRRLGLDFKSAETYLGLEAIMYGRQGSCDDHFGTALLPGWADHGSNSVLINGRPINGAVKVGHSEPNQPCIFLQPCPGGGSELNAGIQLGKLLLSAEEGTLVRITGALILDCGHATKAPPNVRPCYDDTGDMDEVTGSLNQEIHPIYSIDVINFPFRPEDGNVAARANLTGVWAGMDGSTYYIRQIGNTVWWLGQMRDRQPMEPGNHFPMIGVEQLAPAFSAGDPPCSSVTRQCWAFATVFTGSIAGTVDGGEKIQGTWAGVPQSLSPGSSGGSITFVVDHMHKTLAPEIGGTIFPLLTKMYEPEDTTPPKSAITTTSAQAPGAHGPGGAVGGIGDKSAEQVTITATDQRGSGVQNIWYRFYAQGAVPAFSVAQGATVSFTLPAGSFRVEFYATDNAGNDEALHSVVVGVPVAKP